MLKGITDTSAYLKELGFRRTKAYNLSHERHQQVQLSDLDFLCRRLNCTPNDLLEWSPSKPDHDIPDHALQALRRKEHAVDLVKLVQSLPVEDMAKVERFIMEQSKG